MLQRGESLPSLGKWRSWEWPLSGPTCMLVQ